MLLVVSYCLLLTLVWQYGSSPKPKVSNAPRRVSSFVSKTFLDLTSTNADADQMSICNIVIIIVLAAVWVIPTLGTHYSYYDQRNCSLNTTQFWAMLAHLPTWCAVCLKCLFPPPPCLPILRSKSKTSQSVVSASHLPPTGFQHSPKHQQHRHPW